MQQLKHACWLLLPLLLLLLASEAQAQQRLRFTADKVIGRRVEGGQVNVLVGNVVIRQPGTTIYADSAQVRRAENQAEAYGRIRVEEGDSITITSKSLVYEGNTGTAFMTRDVVYRDGATVLYTDNLEFNKFTGISSYHSGGRMVNNENTLTSRRGVFNRPANSASFYSKVVLRSPDATIYSDTLHYNTLTGQATFVGFTRVVRADGTVTEGNDGLVYNTQSERGAVLQGFIENEDYIITGTRLGYDRQRELFTAKGNVTMTAKDQQVIILGTEAYYDKKTGITRIWGRPLMKRPVQQDTLFMSADTMMAIEHELEAKKRLLAWGGVKIFKQDLQGVADSMAYRLADSLLFFYRQPVLWNQQNQLTGDTINLQIRNNTVDRMRLLQNGFVISRDTLGDYNQVKGRLITAFFRDDELSQVAVNGNAESIYFVLEETDSVMVQMGMNRITCANMLINFANRQVRQIRFYQQPDATFVPPHELKEPDTRLSGFVWQEERRPSLADVLSRESSAASSPAPVKGAPERSVPSDGTQTKPAVAPRQGQPERTKPLRPTDRKTTPKPSSGKPTPEDQ
ncbi:OstA-like protein [Cesiribacter andamanensis]|uniref:Organic solvent tolerance protein OstA n=1 Tax=Cesiribacter andamanensis AMV16 TaxID=1279009 RepID=M7N7P5_9BACT|nr:OstA-like protein [Cesiribacter andamanensis]EMR03246.1 Organic solvent tolerance protein OstA [Cesiribacter andamanensis AMV16]